MKFVKSFIIGSGLSLAAAGLAFAEGAGTQGTMSRPGQSQSQMQGQAQGQAQGTGQNSNAPVVLIVPMVTAMDQSMANGCWARLYDSTDYGGNMLTLSGPVDLPSMETGRIAGFEWDRNFDSVIVGPKAALMVWQGDNYSDDAATFRANQRVRDLDTRLGFFEDIKSLKLSCPGAGSSGGGSSSGAGGSSGAGSGTEGQPR